MMTFMNMLFISLLIMFIKSKTPMTKLIFLILQTILVGIFISTIHRNYLWSLIILIVMLGGMFVIFLYISSLTPKSHPLSTLNIKNNWMNILNFSLISMMTLTMFLKSQPYFTMESGSLNISKMYSSFLPSTILIGLYLFFILLVVVIMLQNNKRPIRSK
uniref:NADH dehydrogenase subunit 6 n=1 Tax=Nymphon brevicaudatum TaxID=373287 RepID=UPI00226CEE09|nr:NADH dehydrogenase subunit 6 [Nymphon brevicaudatum]UZA61323.1 NADH dehydrogenase subunit 6 [Nymphon brevicaudatum]